MTPITSKVNEINGVGDAFPHLDPYRQTAVDQAASPSPSRNQTRPGTESGPAKDTASNQSGRILKAEIESTVTDVWCMWSDIRNPASFETKKAVLASALLRITNQNDLQKFRSAAARYVELKLSNQDGEHAKKTINITTLLSDLNRYHDPDWRSASEAPPGPHPVKIQSSADILNAAMNEP